MNEILNKFLSAGDNFMPEIHLNQPQNNHMAYRVFKDLPRGAASDKVLRDKTFNVAKNPKYDGNQRGLNSMVYKFFDKSLLLRIQLNLPVLIL